MVCLLRAEEVDVLVRSDDGGRACEVLARVRSFLVGCRQRQAETVAVTMWTMGGRGSCTNNFSGRRLIPVD
jgi:hypothetical protein